MPVTVISVSVLGGVFLVLSAYHLGRCSGFVACFMIN
jgi:hypothetical protein